MKRWQKRLLKVLGIVVVLVVLNSFTDSKKYVQTACYQSLTVQKYPILEFGCAVATLDWRRADKAFSEIDFELPEEK